jgi:hypothetical protein
MYERMGFVRSPDLDFHPNPKVTVKAYRLELACAGKARRVNYPLSKKRGGKGINE